MQDIIQSEIKFFQRLSVAQLIENLPGQLNRHQMDPINWQSPVQRNQIFIAT